MLSFAGQRMVQDGLLGDAGLLFAAGALLFVVAFWSHRFDPLRSPDHSLPSFPLSAIHRWRARVGVGLLIVSMLLTINALQQFYDFEPFAVEAWGWHGAALLAALAGALLLDTGLQAYAGGNRKVQGWREQGQLFLLLAGIVALALMLRLFRFDDLPFGVWYDEAEHGLQTLRILESDRFRPIFEGAINGPAHFLYLTALSFEWFGVSVQSIRLVSVVFGVLSVVAGYWVGSELFGRSAALLLAIFLAASSWALTFSRFGMFATMSTPLFTLLTAAFVLRGLRTQRPLDYALAGLWLGLGLCFYTSFRLFVPAVYLLLVHWALYERLARRRWPSRNFWIGVGLLTLIAALVAAPVGLYAYKHPDIFWARVEKTFLFADKSEAERWPALWANMRRHLLMFNVFGDPNGRHNLPGNPMLDAVTAPLLVLGAAYALRRMAQPTYLFLLLWMVFGLMGGALSLDFEAPQSLRANATLPVAYILAALPLAALGRAWTLAAGRYFPHALRTPALLLAFAVVFLNADTYFVRQANDFAVWNAYSTPETLTARLLADLDPDTDAYVTSFFRGHPTIKFVARNARPYQELNTLDQFPLDFAPDRSALLILNADSRGLYDEAKRLYPQAQFEESLPPVKGPPVLFTARLSPEDIASIRGLTARYFANDAWEGEPALVRREAQVAADWSQTPLPVPFSVEWEGFLYAKNYGQYEFYLEAPAVAALRIGERVIAEGAGALSGAIVLAEGVHALRVNVVGAPGRVTLGWRTPDGVVSIIPPTVFYNEPRLGHGLLGRYFANGDWRPPEVMSRIDARFDRYIHVVPLPRPYTVEWTGKVAAPVEGLYRFGLESIDESMLWIDETLVVEAQRPNTYAEGEITLSQGLHDIRIRFADRTSHTHINVYWQPPGHERQILPMEVLYPPQESYERVALPSPDTLTSLSPAEQSQPDASLASEPRLQGVARVVADGLLTPRGVAVADDGTIYVAESGGGRISVFDPDGALRSVIDGGPERLREPADVAIFGSRLFVSDVGAGRLRSFTLDGQPLEFAAGLDPTVADRARGVGVTPDGRVLVANTPNNRVVVLGASGEMMAQVVVWPGEDAQPVDAAMGADGRLFVVDGQGHRLIRYTPEGRRDRAWPLAVANTVDGPHLAVDKEGRLYLTEPESGRILLRNLEGEPFGAWSLAELLGRSVKPVGVAVDANGVIWVVDSSGGMLIALEGKLP
ncbi:MAG: PA14 domain-containing protein [Caldilinea sp.]|nr:PA14 domain-containing protein [Caldilinea sp.]MDW8438889.1 PA14 domain-containing protein [Caldilineaceae bacterium]